MSPKVKKFYNKLLSFYLDDNSVYARLENSYQYYIKKQLGKYTQVFSSTVFLEGSQRELELYFAQLSDAEISEAMKTFKMRMLPAPESQVVFKNGTVMSAPTNSGIRGFKN